MSDNYYFQKYRKYKDRYRMVAGSFPKKLHSGGLNNENLNVDLKHNPQDSITARNKTFYNSLTEIWHDPQYTRLIDSIYNYCLEIPSDAVPVDPNTEVKMKIDDNDGYDFKGEKIEGDNALYNVGYFDTLTDFYCENYQRIIDVYKQAGDDGEPTLYNDDDNKHNKYNKHNANTVLHLLVVTYIVGIYAPLLALRDAYAANRAATSASDAYDAEVNAKKAAEAEAAEFATLLDKISKFNDETTLLEWVTSFLDFFRTIQYVRLLKWTGSDRDICIRDKNGTKYKLPASGNKLPASGNNLDTKIRECFPPTHCKVEGKRASVYLTTELEQLEKFRDPDCWPGLSTRPDPAYIRNGPNIIKYHDIYLVKGSCKF